MATLAPIISTLACNHSICQHVRMNSSLELNTNRLEIDKKGIRFPAFCVLNHIFEVHSTLTHHLDFIMVYQVCRSVIFLHCREVSSSSLQQSFRAKYLHLISSGHYTALNALCAFGRILVIMPMNCTFCRSLKVSNFCF